MELNGCNEQLLDDLSRVKSALIDAADEAGATIVGEIFHEFSPVGLTGVVPIPASEISNQTWP